MENRFTLTEFRKQMRMIAKPGLMQKMMGMMPGMGQMRDAMNKFDESEMKGLFGIIDSMTPAERADSKRIDRSRRGRIAAGAGCTSREVLELVRQYESMANVIEAMADKGMLERMRILGEIQERKFKERKWPPFPPDDEDDDRPPDNPPPPLPA